jgi:hypothetical protein
MQPITSIAALWQEASDQKDRTQSKAARFKTIGI